MGCIGGLARARPSIKISFLRSLYQAAFLDRRAAGAERGVALEAFLDSVPVDGFTNSPKLGQMVARPQLAQSGFWEKQQRRPCQISQ
jgi:hypothetical protein